MTVYRVLIVDDSRFMRQVLSDVVNADESFTVVSTASDGEEAFRLALELQPDIITMDLEMPRMNGLEALRKIMAARPTPVIMLSAVTDNGARDTIKALQYGAFDFVRKPDRSVNLEIGDVSAYLLEKLRIAAESLRAGTLRMLPAVEESAQASPPAASDPPQEPPKGDSEISRPDRVFVREKQADPRKGVPSERASPVLDARMAGLMKNRHKPQQTVPRLKVLPPVSGTAAPRKSRSGKAEIAPEARPPDQADKLRHSASFVHLVAVGVSTGGPRALHELLTNLPADFEAPLLVVQHMPPKFTRSLAQRLNAFCAIRVREAEDGDVVETATAYIAPGGKQMTLAKESSGMYRIRLSEDGPRNGHMPSVDVLFESLIGHHGLKRHAVLMTGMGSDGALGMKALQQDGVETRIAESAETCVVYGMPRSAVELGAVSQVLPLQQIAPYLVREVRSSRPHQSPQPST